MDTGFIIDNCFDFVMLVLLLLLLVIMAAGGRGAFRFDLPKELMDVVESVEIVDKLLRIWSRSKLLLFKLDIDIDLDGRFTLPLLPPPPLVFLCKLSRLGK